MPRGNSCVLHVKFLGILRVLRLTWVCVILHKLCQTQVSSTLLENEVQEVVDDPFGDDLNDPVSYANWVATVLRLWVAKLWTSNRPTQIQVNRRTLNILETLRVIRKNCGRGICSLPLQFP